MEKLFSNVYPNHTIPSQQPNFNSTVSPLRDETLHALNVHLKVQDVNSDKTNSQITDQKLHSEKKNIHVVNSPYYEGIAASFQQRYIPATAYDSFGGYGGTKSPVSTSSANFRGHATKQMAAEHPLHPTDGHQSVNKQQSNRQALDIIIGEVSSLSGIQQQQYNSSTASPNFNNNSNLSSSLTATESAPHSAAQRIAIPPQYPSFWGRSVGVQDTISGSVAQSRFENMKVAAASALANVSFENRAVSSGINSSNNFNNSNRGVSNGTTLCDGSKLPSAGYGDLHGIYNSRTVSSGAAAADSSDGDLSASSFSSGPASSSSEESEGELSDIINESDNVADGISSNDIETAVFQQTHDEGAMTYSGWMSHNYDDQLVVNPPRRGRNRKPVVPYDGGTLTRNSRRHINSKLGNMSQPPAQFQQDSNGYMTSSNDSSATNSNFSSSVEYGSGAHGGAGEFIIHEEGNSLNYGGYSGRARQLLSERRTRNNSSSKGPYGRPRRHEGFHIGRIGRLSGRSSSLRERKTVNYAEMGTGFETDEEERAIEEERMNQQMEREFIHGVDRVLSSRRNDETGEIKYLIKWRGQAHIHNTWEGYETLQHVYGIKKVDNFIRKQQEAEKRRAAMTLDELEQEDIAAELQRQIDDDSLNAERIVEVGPDPTTGVQTFLVKWQSCSYDQCTWETRETIESHGFKALIDEYYEREGRIHGSRTEGSVLTPQSLSYTKFEPYTSTPFYISKSDGPKKLRDYQLTGLNWMVSRMKHGLSVLLADEMGLGKTVQTISVIGHMLFVERLVGPYLVIVPQSTIDNWMREFQYWLPDANAVCFHGNAVGRDILRYYELRQIHVRDRGKRWRFDVCVTAPSILNSPSDLDFLRRIPWQLMVVDEAHQLKNRNSKRFQELRLFQSEYKLLLSGTPLHNNLEELWSLLHFMNPVKYTYYEDFWAHYPDIENTAAIGEAKQRQLANLQAELHEVVLRRVKKDVEKSLPNKVESILQVEMSPYQELWYESVYTRNYEQLARTSGGAKSSLQNICMELKKVCNHPFLCALPTGAMQYNAGLVHGSGKMCLLEKLLMRLKEKNHRVLIFSQMVRMLNILSDYLTQKGFKHQRLDGSMGKEVRKKAMDHFNEPDSDDFAFLLSTKAGGLGINLTSADTVIIYDSDWNPQNDLQAEARAHRIGQTKTVQIYRLVTKNSIEQGILERAKTKMVLDTLVVQGLNKRHTDSNELLLAASPSTSFSREELSKILKFGASNLWKRCDTQRQTLEQGVDVDLDQVLREAQVSVNDTSGVADDLLSSFNNITEFRYEPPVEEQSDMNDKNFWSTTIPLEERLKYQQDKEQELLVTGKRKTRTAVSGDYADEQDSTDESKRKRPAAKIKKKANHVSDKDRYRLYRSLLKYGIPDTRLDDIYDDSRLGKIDKKLVEQECKNVINACRKRLQEIGYRHNYDEDDEKCETSSQQLNGDSSKDDGGDLNGKTALTSRHFVAIGENKANAADLIERVELLTMLDKYVKAQNPGVIEPWKLPTGPIAPTKYAPSSDDPASWLQLSLPEKVIKKLKEWTAKDVRDWGPEQDVSLIKGTYIYGFGSWTEVHSDPNLELGQIKEIKYDKVKMRALRTLKLLASISRDGRGKSKKKNQREEATTTLAVQLNGTTQKFDDDTDGGSQEPIIMSPSIINNNESDVVLPRPNSTATITTSGAGGGTTGKSKKKHRLNVDGMSAASTNSKKLKTVGSAIQNPAFHSGNVSVSEAISKRAKRILKPVKKTLRSLRKMTNDDGKADTELIGHMKLSLPIIGDHIYDALKKCDSDDARKELEMGCWARVSKYTVATPDELRHVYAQLCDLNVSSRHISGGERSSGGN